MKIKKCGIASINNHSMSVKEKDRIKFYNMLMNTNVKTDNSPSNKNRVILNSNNNPKDNEIKETTTLDSIFQRSDIHFFRVKSGLVLGNFDKNNIGFEVVVNDIGESINLSDIRDIETIIEHNPSENDNDIEARTKKE